MLNLDYTPNHLEEWLGTFAPLDTLADASKEPIEFSWPIFDDLSSILAWGSESPPSETCSTPLTLVSDYGLREASETEAGALAYSDDDLDIPAPPDESELYAVDCDLYEHRYSAEKTSSVLLPLSDGEGSRVDIFLEESGLYNACLRRWSNIPTDPSDAQCLISPFQEIFEAILRCFQVTGSRFVSHGLKMRRTAHGHYKAIPILAVSGTGPIFCVDSGVETPASKKGYSSLVTPIDVKLRKECWLATDLAQLGMFAR